MLSRTAAKLPRRIPWLLAVVLPLMIWLKAVHMSGFLWKWSVAWRAFNADLLTGR